MTMATWWPDARADLASGDTERSNRAIDAVTDRDIAGRLGLAERHLDDLIELYEASEDGYVRQSVVRVVENLVPDIIGAVAVHNEDRDVDAETVRDRTDHCAEFLLEAITDDDGRVRQSAGRGLQNVARTYDGLEDNAAVALLVHELDRRAESVDEEVSEQIQQAKRDVAHFGQAGIVRVVENLEGEWMDRL